MKIIISPLCGEKIITARDQNIKLFQVKQVLNQHRDLLINNLLNDIPRYLAIKHHVYATPDEIQEIKSKLVSLQQKDINLVNYASIVAQIKSRSKVKLNNVIFFQEIDEMLFAPRISKQ